MSDDLEGGACPVESRNGRCSPVQVRNHLATPARWLCRARNPDRVGRRCNSRCSSPKRSSMRAVSAPTAYWERERRNCAAISSGHQLKPATVESDDEGTRIARASRQWPRRVNHAAGSACLRARCRRVTYLRSTVLGQIGDPTLRSTMARCLGTGLRAWKGGPTAAATEIPVRRSESSRRPR